MREREMSYVCVFEDGSVEVEALGLCNLATQTLYCYRNGKESLAQYCIKGREDYYIKKLALQMINDKKKEIAGLKRDQRMLERNFKKLLS